MKQTWTEKSLEELADRLVLAKGREPEAGRGGVGDAGSWGRAVFLVGAGCSASADIPLGAEVAQRCARDLARIYEAHDRAPGGPATDFGDADAALRWLIENRRVQDRRTQAGKPDWGSYYTDFFDNHLTSVNRQREFFDTIIREAEDKLNWSHACLGELVARRYVHTVLTTNFDQLVLQGVIRTGLLPVVADGIESLNRVTAEPKRPQIVHLHGSMHTYDPRNSRAAIMATRQDPTLRSMLYTILHRCDLLVVVGYAGGEEGIMELLREAARQLPPLMVFWALRDQSSSLSAGAEELMNIGDNKFVVRCPDADTLFQALMNRLKIGEPAWLKDPVATLTAQNERLARPKDPELAAAVARFAARVDHIAREGRPKDTLADELETMRLAGRYTDVLTRLDEVGQETLDVRLLKIRATTNLNLVQEAGAGEGALKALDGERLSRAVADFDTLCSDPGYPDRLHLHGQLFQARMMRYEGLDDEADLSAIVEKAEAAAGLYDGAPAARTIAVRLLVAQARQQRGALARGGEVEAVADLNGAIAGFREVLGLVEDLPRDRRWAECKDGLATTLQLVVEQEKVPEGGDRKAAIGKLDEAVGHHRDLLLLNLGARSLDQAGRLRNLATTIVARAKVDPGTRLSLQDALAYLEQAIAIYEAQGDDLGDEAGQAGKELNDVKALLAA